MTRPVDIVRHRSELGDWEFASAVPARALRGSVSRYVGYLERSPLSVRRREPAGPVAVMVLSFGPKIRHLDPSDPDGDGLEVGSFVAGPDDRWALTEYRGVQHGIQLDLSPVAAGQLLRVSMDSLRGRVVSLEDAMGARAGYLTERLAETRGWEARFGLIDSFLGSALDGPSRAPPEVLHALHRLHRSAGRVSVRTLAAETGWSRRHLIARFRSAVGLTPGKLARILRFRRALRLVDRRLPLAEVALAAGYFDHAHMDRDFRAFAGGPPTDYLARRGPGPGISGS